MTGESKRVDAVGYGSTVEEARANCHAQTLKKATELADKLNKGQ